MTVEVVPHRRGLPKTRKQKKMTGSEIPADAFFSVNFAILLIK
jgi:hypothetical protein